MQTSMISFCTNSVTAPDFSPDSDVVKDKKRDEVVTVSIGPYDVLCGRDKTSFNHGKCEPRKLLKLCFLKGSVWRLFFGLSQVGNRRFRITVALSLERYINAPTREDKSLVILSVIDLISENGGRFLKRKKGKWISLVRDHIGDHNAVNTSML